MVVGKAEGEAVPTPPMTWPLPPNLISCQGRGALRDAAGPDQAPTSAAPSGPSPPISEREAVHLKVNTEVTLILFSFFFF